MGCGTSAPPQATRLPAERSARDSTDGSSRDEGDAWEPVVEQAASRSSSRSSGLWAAKAAEALQRPAMSLRSLSSDHSQDDAVGGISKSRSDGGFSPARSWSRFTSHEDDEEGEAEGALVTGQTAASLDASQQERHVLDFIDRSRFQALIFGCISGNIVLIGVETDLPHFAGSVFLDNAFLLVFFAELALRLAYKGFGWYRKEPGWAILDTFIVVMGVLDLWIAPLLVESEGVQSNKSSLLRFLRLLRLLRLVRVAKMYPKIMIMIQGIVSMIGTFVWIYMVLFIFILCCGIVLTQTLGHGHHDDESIRENFRNVGTSMYTLFQVTTTDNWNAISRPIIALSPWWRVFFVIFIGFTSWTMIAALTGVAADCVISAEKQQREQIERDQQKKQQDFIKFLRDAFTEADEDNSGSLDRAEFEAMIKSPFVLRQMRRLGVHLTMEDMYKAWKILDVDGSNELDIDEFVEGLTFMQEDLTTRHVMDIDYSLKRVSARLEVRINKLSDRLEEIRQQNEDIVQCLNTQEELCSQTNMSLWLFHQWSSKHDPKAIPPSLSHLFPSSRPPDPSRPPQSQRS